MPTGLAVVLTRRSLRGLAAAAVLFAVALLPATAMGAPGSSSQATIDSAIAKGVGFYDANQNADGSWGSSFKGAETALALTSYGVHAKGHFANLDAAQQDRVKKGYAFLLGTQQSNGSFTADGLATYDTGIALIALGTLPDVPTTPADAIAKATAGGRSFLISNQNAPPNEKCQSSGASGTGDGGQTYCGGWDYSGLSTRSDQSNTGFGITGLDLSGGVPAAVAAANVGWQRNVQELKSTNPNFATRNDGGADYEPGIGSGDFSSNANDTGSMLFGLGYDGVPGSDPSVAAGLKFGNDVLDVYELSKATSRIMVFHTGNEEDGACNPGSAGCDWQTANGEGGYHYSMFALQKGLSQYIAPNLADPSNYYAKIVDLLLTEQSPDGSWPADLRDDGSVFAATGFAILALGRVGSPPLPVTPAAPAPQPGVVCSRRDISLIRADVRGRNVVLSGLVSPRFAGQAVTILANYGVRSKAKSKSGRVNTLATVKANAAGEFTATVRRPSKKVLKKARFRARVGRSTSFVVKLPQSLTSRSVQRKDGQIEVTGKVKRSLLGRRNLVTVKKLVCGRYRTVGSAKPDKNGNYVVRFNPPPLGEAAFYRAETRVLNKARGRGRHYVKQYARAISITVTNQTG